MPAPRSNKFYTYLAATAIMAWGGFTFSIAQGDTNHAAPLYSQAKQSNPQQQVSPQYQYQYKPAMFVPPDSIPFMVDVSAGLGIPYGVFGLKGTIGISPISVPGGINLGCSAGLLPFANDFFFNPSVELLLFDRFTALRPKFTFTYSKGTAVILVLNTDLRPLLYKIYPGFGTYLGIDWRLSKTVPISLDANIGWLFHSVGKDKMLAEFKTGLDSLKRIGYSTQINDAKIDPEKQVNSAFYSPKISVGLTLAIRRTLKEITSY